MLTDAKIERPIRAAGGGSELVFKAGACARTEQKVGGSWLIAHCITVLSIVRRQQQAFELLDDPSRTNIRANAARLFGILLKRAW